MVKRRNPIFFIFEVTVFYVSGADSQNGCTQFLILRRPFLTFREGRKQSGRVWITLHKLFSRLTELVGGGLWWHDRSHGWGHAHWHHGCSGHAHYHAWLLLKVAN